MGTLAVSQAGNDPGLLPVIVQMAPIVVVVLYHRLGGFKPLRGSILGDIVCRESAMRKDSTDIAVLVMRLHLYRNILQQRTVSLPSLLQGAWLAPPLRQLHLTLPESKDQVLRVMRISHSKHLGGMLFFCFPKRLCFSCVLCTCWQSSISQLCKHDKGDLSSQEMGAASSSDLRNFEDTSRRACAEAALLPDFAYIGPGNRCAVVLCSKRCLSQCVTG